ncbi:MAG: thiamine pyrophosphate-binding protein [Planctomycetota bacterium]|nr:MAG: thiamine pyrophosphate-binding protein [Planctomycetota bacterium]
MDENANGGELMAQVFVERGVKYIFTLCGGHISPILVASKAKGIRVVDVRDEASAVFAADAVARLSGIPGVAVVTAGPGLTNTITAVKNAQLAQFPLLVIGGATATILKDRGSLQDIDQMALMRPHVKWAARAGRVGELASLTEEAFFRALEGVPGPVFLEVPVDLLYPRPLVYQWYGVSQSRGSGWRDRLFHWYLKRHLKRIFGGRARVQDLDFTSLLSSFSPTTSELHRALAFLGEARRPVMLIGSQAMLFPQRVEELQKAVLQLGIPTYLSGMARGLLGRKSSLQFRHKRRQALKEADLVILAGVPCDFRLDYGRHISSRARLISINRSREELRKNRRPELGILADPGLFLMELAKMGFSPLLGWEEWIGELRGREEKREEEIQQQAEQKTEFVNPLAFFQVLERILPEESVIVADGGDFVATASYILRPRGPLSWLDPGVFGTLGVGGGFALGAKLARPDCQVWLLYGDGSSAYSLAELDTAFRHRIPFIAVVGNDACWSQIAREQVEIFQDPVSTKLSYSDYHKVAQGYGAEGLLLEDPGKVEEVLKSAQELVHRGRPVLVNVKLGKTDFRKGSISM